ncbi:MAG TPA: MarR family transcriptional regulator [Candidatus Limnocylindrales bacterium]|nr:MarR family transcriptional regulator [Candidatus Limnocylindrales bacterium]
MTPGAEHGALVDEVVGELTSWNPREFIAAFQRWHQGQISLIQLNVLTLLEATGPLPMSRLAGALDISVASLTGIVDRMEARSLVKRKRDAEDRRVVKVAPAAGGRKLFAQIDRRRRDGLRRLLANLAEEELRGLLVGHRALRAARANLATRAAGATGVTGTTGAAGATGALRKAATR